MKLNVTAFLIIILSLSANSQSYTITANPTLKYLYNTKNEIGTISNTKNLHLFPLIIGNNNARFKLIKNEAGLFALIDGTGQVYKATNLDQTKMTFSRIDSTHFYGNTFESINFSYKGTIYNFGGYGFWNMNGLLSHFSNNLEWNIDKINKTYFTTNQFYSYQPKESKLYFVEYPRVSEFTFDKTDNTLLIEFDIIKKENKVLGTINKKANVSNPYFKIDLPSLNGLIASDNNDIFLYNFSANKIFKLTNSKIKDELIGKAGAELQTSFEDQGKVFYSFNNDTTLRSFQISMNDFIEIPYPLYIPENSYNYYWLVGIGLFIIAFIIIVFINRNRKKIPATNEKEETYTIDLNSNEFNTIEKILIDKLIEKSKMDSHLTVEELNTILGIKKKTIEIQKRVRNEAIIRINHKFNINFNRETTFIERIRSIEDKRYFNYIINKENAKIYTEYSK
jgi:hypothetical protein